MVTCPYPFIALRARAAIAATSRNLPFIRNPSIGPKVKHLVVDAVDA
jgi:hypothetical protein